MAGTESEEKTQARIAELEVALEVAESTMDMAGKAYEALLGQLDALSIGVQVAATQEEVARRALREQLRAAERENEELRAKLKQ